MPTNYDSQAFMTRPHLNQQTWMKLSIEQSIIASLRTQISKEDLLDEQWLKFKDKAQETTNSGTFERLTKLGRSSFLAAAWKAMRLFAAKKSLK
jgi:hypothetical protein